VMKNVTGYDLVKLMAGSWGTLGVLSEVALKVLPKPEAELSLSVEVADTATAVKLMSAALGSSFEASGAAYDPAVGRACVRVEGFGDSVAYRAQRLTELLQGIGDVRQIDEPGLWASIRDAAVFHDLEGDLWRLSVSPGDAPEIARRADAERLLLDWGGGLIWALVPVGTDLRDLLGPFDGHATLVRASVDTLANLGRFQPEIATVSALTQGIRRKFDPQGLFNPWLMG